MAAATGRTTERRAARMTMTADSPCATATRSPARRAGAQLIDTVFKARELAIAGVLVVMLARHPDRQQRVPVRAGHQGPAAQRDDPGAGRRRPGRRGHHPQHRPVGRLGARHLRLRLRQASSHGGGNPLVAVLLAVALGAVCGLAQRRARQLRPGARARRHARHALHHPGHRLHLGRLQQQITAADLPTASSTSAPTASRSCPYLRAARRRRAARASRYYLRSYRSGREMYAIGSSPEAARLAGCPGPQAHPGRVRPSAARSPGSPAPCAWPASATSTPQRGNG